MRTNIDIDDKLMKKAIQASGEKTKKGTVVAALRLMVNLKDQERYVICGVLAGGKATLSSRG